MTFNLAANNTSATGRSTIIGSDPLLAFETSNAAGVSRNLTIPPQFFTKKTANVTLVPRLEYKLGRLTLEAKGSLSRAKNTYDALHAGPPFTAQLNQLTNANFRFERGGHDTFDWTITQISGPDATDFANYQTATRRIRDEFRLIRNVRSSGQVDARYDVAKGWFSSIKAGAKLAEDIYDHYQFDPWYAYTGPGNWVPYESAVKADMGTSGVQFRSLSGQPMRPPQPNLEEIGRLFRSHPEWFNRETMPPGDWYNFNVNTRRYFIEKVTSGYLVAHSSPARRLQFQAGLRWEKTETEARVPDQRTRAEVVAAGFPVDGTGRASTIPGLEYQFFTKPRLWRGGEYDDLFPSASAKYMFTKDLVAHFGYHRAISRPPVGVLAGAWSVNEVTKVVQLGNPNLLPEYSNSYSARVSYYLSAVGQISGGVFQNDISNLRITDDFSAAEFGYGDDPVYSEYVFRTVTNGNDTKRFRGMELEYSQHLTFLPGLLGGLNISGSYVRNYASLRRPGLVPHRYTGAVGFKHRRLNLRFSAAWMAETPWTGDVLGFQPAKTTFDVSGGYQLTRRVGFFFSGRNITNEIERINQWVDASRSSWFLWRQRQYGAAWTFGLKGTF
jgi:TonB-dependent receptor